MDIVLVHPEIPQNTGSIARTCAATRTPLHLIEPMKFSIDEKRVRRAGLDYWPYVDLSIHESWEAYHKAREPRKVWLLTKFATRPYHAAEFSAGDAILFGSESLGLPAAIKDSFPKENHLLIPMLEPKVRSLNLSNAVSIVLYEALRQQDRKP